MFNHLRKLTPWALFLPYSFFSLNQENRSIIANIDLPGSSMTACLKYIGLIYTHYHKSCHIIMLKCHEHGFILPIIINLPFYIPSGFQGGWTKGEKIGIKHVWNIPIYWKRHYQSLLKDSIMCILKILNASQICMFPKKLSLFVYF